MDQRPELEEDRRCRRRQGYRDPLTLHDRGVGEGQNARLDIRLLRLLRRDDVADRRDRDMGPRASRPVWPGLSSLRRAWRWRDGLGQWRRRHLHRQAVTFFSSLLNAP